MTEDEVADLRQRIGNAMAEIDRLANKAAAAHNITEYTRLTGKREGLGVALDYLRGYGSQ